MRGILMGRTASTGRPGNTGSTRMVGALTALGLGVWGCSSAGTTPSANAVTLQLTGDGQHVSLKGSPLDSTYEASYPVTGVSRMVVNVLRTGDIAAACESGGVYGDCSDQPFFTEAIRTGNSSHVMVFDLYGVKVADTITCVSDAAGNGCPGDPPEAPPSGSGGSAGSGGSGGTGGSGACGGSGGSGGSAGTGGTGGSSGGGAQCDAAAVAAEQAQFCAAVDQWLVDHGITSYQLDCSQLNGQFNYSSAQPPEVHQDIPCMEEIKEAWDQAWATLGTCDAAVQGIVMNWKSSSRWLLIQQGTCRGSPLVLDLDGNGVELGALDQGVAFDLFGTGHKMKTAWVSGGDGLLFLDRNGNGVVDGATELFGNVTAGRSFDDGFAALGELDSNGDGRVDAKDPAYAELEVWRDANHDGRSQPRELTLLADAGVRALLVAATRDDGAASWDKHGNQTPLVGSFVKDDGQTGMVVDAYLRFQPLR